MQKKKYSKPVLEVEYYTLETTIAACGESGTASSSYDDQTSEDNLGFSTYAMNGDGCGCYYSSGAPASAAQSWS